MGDETSRKVIDCTSPVLDAVPSRVAIDTCSWRVLDLSVKRSCWRARFARESGGAPVAVGERVRVSIVPEGDLVNWKGRKPRGRVLCFWTDFPTFLFPRVGDWRETED